MMMLWFLIPLLVEIPDSMFPDSMRLSEKSWLSVRLFYLPAVFGDDRQNSLLQCHENPKPGIPLATLRPIRWLCRKNVRSCPICTNRNERKSAKKVALLGSIVDSTS